MRFLLGSLLVLCIYFSGCRSAEAILFSEGEDQLKRLSYEEARRSFTRYISLRPDDPAGYYNRGLAAAGSDNYTEAEADFKKVLELDPRNTDALWMRYRLKVLYRDAMASPADSQTNERPLQQTLFSALTALMMEDLNKLLEIDRSDVSARYERATLLQRLGRNDEAKNDLTIALFYAPWDIWVRNERGKVMHELGDYAAAVDDYDAALASCDTCTWLLYNKALSLKAGGAPGKAAEVLRSLVSLDSTDGDAWYLLAECEIQAGRQDLGCEALSRSMQLGVAEAQRRFEELCR